MTRIKGLSLIVLALLGLAFLAEVGCNLYDQPYRAEVAKILAAPAPELSESARNAYHYLLGVQIGETREPESRGAEVAAKLGESGVMDDLGGRPSPWLTNFNGCMDEAGCGATDAALSENLAALEREQDLVQRYLRLMAYADFDSSFRPDARVMMDPVRLPDPRVHMLFTLQLARWASQGGIERVWHEIENSNRFYAGVLRSGPLLWRMIAAIQLGRNARFVQKEVMRVPTHRVPGELIESFDVPDVNDILGGALDEETRVVKAMIDGFGWRRIFMRPRETLNVHHELAAQMLFTDCPEATEACVPATAYLKRGGLYGWLINPAGRELVKTVTVGLNLRPKLMARLQNILTIKEELRHRP